MTERAQQAGLGAEALARLSGLDAGVRTEELEREVLPGRLVVDAPDVARRAAPDQGDRNEAADALAGAEGRRGDIRRDVGGVGRGEIAPDIVGVHRGAAPSSISRLRTSAARRSVRRFLIW